MTPVPSDATAAAWLQRLVRSPHALRLLFAASMAETLVVPVPIELVLVPWMLMHPERKWTIAAVALAGNLCAASAGYALGAFAMDAWGDRLVALAGGGEAYDALVARLEQDGFMAVLAIGIVPIPFQVAMLASGATGYPFALFLLAALLGRSARYFGLALLVAWAGDAAMRLWQRYSTPLGISALALFGAWAWMQFGR